MASQDFAVRALPRLANRRKEAREFRLIYFMTFPAFLVVVLFARLIPGQKPASFPGRAQRRSVFGEAAEMARSSLPMMFMG